MHWLARHSQVSAHGFTDTLERGLLQHWAHTHTFKALGPALVEVHEHIDFEHAAGWRGWQSRLLFAPVGLRYLFHYRALATRRALE